MRSQRRLISLLLLTAAAACGGPVAEGRWQLQEIMSHRCRSAGDTGLICDSDEALPTARSEGAVTIVDLGYNRLQLIDVDGRVTVGRSYVDGARFRWLERRTDDGACVETSDEILELVVEGEGLSGQRRVYAAQSEACGAASITDEGFVVYAVRLAEEAP
jgi:hypothetical protein